MKPSELFRICLSLTALDLRVYLYKTYVVSRLLCAKDIYPSISSESVILCKSYLIGLSTVFLSEIRVQTITPRFCILRFRTNFRVQSLPLKNPKRKKDDDELDDHLLSPYYLYK